jgi:hypothetical protein
MPVLSVYEELIQYEEVGGDMTARLSKMNLRQVFEPVIVYYGAEADILNKVLFYILHIYSKESKFIVPGQDYLGTKQRCCDRLGIPEDLKCQHESFVYQDLVFLESSDVVDTVQRYLKLQMSKTFEHLVMKRELYLQMVQSAMGRLTDHNGVVDYDQKFKNSGYAEKLYGEIYHWEQQLSAEHPELKSAIEELRERKTVAGKASLRIEDILKQQT